MKIKHYDRNGNEFIKFDIIPNLIHAIKTVTSKEVRKKLRFLLNCKHTCAICGVKAYYIGYYKNKGNGAMKIDLYTKDGIIFNVDHIIPISKNGADLDINKQCTCITCNTKKGSDLPDGTLVKVVSGKYVPYIP